MVEAGFELATEWQNTLKFSSTHISYLLLMNPFLQNTLQLFFRLYQNTKSPLGSLVPPHFLLLYFGTCVW